MVTMRFWVIYVWFFSCVLVLSLIGRVVLFFKRPEAVSRFSIHEFFTDKMKKIYKLAWFKSLATIALQVALGGPALWALVRYSFFEPLLWS
jgi:hypothetical protein